MSRKRTARPETDDPTDDAVAAAIDDATRSSSTGGGSPVYGLGMIGALVWFWSQAETSEERAIAVLKAVVWPAFLVHDAFKALSD
jgi:hypothetical protein